MNTPYHETTGRTRGRSETALNVMNPYIVVYFWKRTL